eukprot:COSAG02_NODE_17400_length_1006_cov_1.962514_1_plen_78_part_10
MCDARFPLPNCQAFTAISLRCHRAARRKDIFHTWVCEILRHWLFSTSNSTRPLLVTDLDLAHLFEVDCVRASFKHDAT